MKKLNIFLFASSLLLFINCKKNYSCVCSDPGGVFKTYEIKDTKSKATDKCEAYNKEYQTIPVSETVCTLR
jgi:hypothetical protein